MAGRRSLGSSVGVEKVGLQITALVAANDDCSVEGDGMGYIGTLAIRMLLGAHGFYEGGIWF